VSRERPLYASVAEARDAVRRHIFYASEVRLFEEGCVKEGLRQAQEEAKSREFFCLPPRQLPSCEERPAQWDDELRRVVSTKERLHLNRAAAAAAAAAVQEANATAAASVDVKPRSSVKKDGAEQSQSSIALPIPTSITLPVSPSRKTQGADKVTQQAGSASDAVRARAHCFSVLQRSKNSENCRSCTGSLCAACSGRSRCTDSDSRASHSDQRHRKVG
jgi:hypothetical protein